MFNGVEPGPGWWIALLGWPVIFVALIAFSLAVVRKSRKSGIVGCLLAAPMFLYLSITPRFWWAASLSFVLLCVLAWRIKKSAWLVNLILVLPAISLLVTVAYAVATQ